MAKVMKEQDDLKKKLAHERAISKRLYVTENGVRFLRIMARLAVQQGITDVAVPLNMGNLGEFAISVRQGNYYFVLNIRFYFFSK